MPPSISKSSKSTIGRSKIYGRIFGTLSTAAPWLAVRIAERLFVTPHSPQPPEREQAWARNARSFAIPFAGRSLAGWEWGAGSRTVLLVHGWAGRGLQLGRFARPLVEQGFRVVTYDAPAHGESAGRTSSLLEMIDAVVAAGRSVGPISGLVAHSLGSVAALLALGRRRLEAERAVIIAPVARTEAMIGRFGNLTGFTAPVLRRMRDRFEIRLGFRWSEIEPLRIAHEVRVPLLVVHDRHDQEIPSSEGSLLAEWCPRGRLAHTTGLGHRRILRDPLVIRFSIDHLAASTAPTPLSEVSEPAWHHTASRPEARI
jgi:pimeloyl-ACP methyl ester carboxylesterase